MTYSALAPVSSCLLSGPTCNAQQLRTSCSFQVSHQREQPNAPSRTIVTAQKKVLFFTRNRARHWISLFQQLDQKFHGRPCVLRRVADLVRLTDFGRRARFETCRFWSGGRGIRLGLSIVMGMRDRLTATCCGRRLFLRIHHQSGRKIFSLVEDGVTAEV